MLRHHDKMRQEEVSRDRSVDDGNWSRDCSIDEVEPVVDPLVNQAEAEVARHEVAAAAKASQAVVLGRRLARELKQVEARARDLNDMDLRSELRNRLDGVALPSLDLEAHMKRATEARWRAIEVRSETLAELERATGQLMQQLESAGCRLEKLVNEVTAAEFWDREASYEPRMVVGEPATTETDKGGETETAEAKKRVEAKERVEANARVEVERVKPARAAIEDRRSHPRVPLSVRVGYQSETNFYGGITEDLSVGGIFVATYDVLPCGHQIDINVRLPTGHELRTRGTVRWLREHNDLNPLIPSGMGVEFEELSAADRDAIEAFVAEREPLLYVD